MRVILVTSTEPFVHGGATAIVDWLEDALVDRGHEVETYRIPVYPTAAELPAQMVGLRLWDFSGHGDRLVAVRTPSYLVKHHHKVAWFIHHHRPAYDIWPKYRDVPDDPGGWEFRRMLFASDDVSLSECKALFTNSKRVSERLKRFNDLESEVLYPPLGEKISYRDGPVGDTLVYVSRVVPHKRQLLAVQALARTRFPVRLAIAGATPAVIDYGAQVAAEIDRLGLARRVTFLNTTVSEETKADFLADCLGVVYLPEDEDSYGFVSLEAASVAKPVVTTTDSGGVTEFVQDGVNGLVAEPTPDSIARAFDRLYESRHMAAEMGAAIRRRPLELDISWDHVVDRLLA